MYVAAPVSVLFGGGGITYRILLTMFDNLNAAGGVARSVKQRDSAGVGHIIFAALEAPIKRAVGQVIVYGRLIDGHLANAVRKDDKSINEILLSIKYFSNTYRTEFNASFMASSDQGVGFDRDSSMPSRLQRP